MSWTDERVETLRKLWLEGLSATQIANALSCGVTRSAVIGKLHRLGLNVKARPGGAKAAQPKPAPVLKSRPKPAAPASALPEVPPMRAFNEHPEEARKGKNDIGDEERAEIVKRADAPAPASQHVTIMELRESMCRWPLGDPASPDFRYCGDVAPIGEGPYCKFHMKVAYVPSRPRKPMSDEQKEAIRRGLARSNFGRTLANG